MAAIGGILAAVAGIAMLVFWIMTLIKQFKSNDVLWGVLTIFFGILAPIWCFMKGHKKLGMNFVIAFIVYIIAVVVLGASGGFQVPA